MIQFNAHRFRFPVLVFCAVLLLALGATGVAFGGPIHDAVKKGDLEQVRALLKASPELVRSKDEKEMTPLDLAAVGGRLDIAELLIDNHADVNGVGKDGKPLDYASMFGQVEMVKLLLAKGADLNAHTPLVLAASLGRKEVTNLLLDKGAKINAKAGNGATALNMTAQWGGKEMIELLLARGADISARDADGDTPLLDAAFNDKQDNVAVLLAHHANVNAQDSEGRTALLYAAGNGKQDLARLLLANKASVNLGFRGGVTPLHAAATGGDKEMALLLLTHGADIDARDDKLGETPAGWAKLNDKTEMAMFLQDYSKAHPAKSAPGIANGTGPTSQNGETLHALTNSDGLSCAFTQDISASVGYGLSGTMSASTNHFKCKARTGKEVEIELVSTNPNVNAGIEHGKVAIRTKMFGTVYRGNSSSTFGTYEMTESQIKRLQTFLGF
jgi:ankyrin repeat protein